jgi:uncharacterized protein (UPF0332 family)
MKKDELKALVRYRLGQAETALDDAKFLLEGKRSPQSVINRAYYAMFYSALALLESTGEVPSKHTGVVSLFDTEFVLKGIFPKELSRDFHRAFELRQISDYKVTENLSLEKAEEMLNRAYEFVEAVRSNLLPE